ncbi:MAG: KEOPS complex subunit Cgi121 [Promethearchaeota archaeon]
MIVKEFYIEDLSLNYFVGITQVKIDLEKFLHYYDIDNEEKALIKFFNIIDEIQDRNENLMVQFVKDKYILNQDHIFIASYYFQKAFKQKINISNKRNIEFLLYLAINRQIIKSIQAFGIEFSDLKNSLLTLCIISPFDAINSVWNDLSSVIFAQEQKLTIDHQSLTKYNMIKEFYEISETQINSVLRSYEIDKNKLVFNISLKFSALYDLICEKMALLSVEKTR